jgi:geranylgeranyl diphosphate synthase type I
MKLNLQNNQLPEIFIKYQEIIQQSLRPALSLDHGELNLLSHYQMGWVDENGNNSTGSSGKALRPSLCLLACEAVGGQINLAVPLAIALEIIHNFSLVHDDIQDEDLLRRHRPTVWAVWGKKLALIAGNAMRTSADMNIYSLRSLGTTSDRVIYAINLLTERYLEMIEGQYQDISFEKRTDVSTQEYLDMVEKKTGSLIEAALHMGAYIGSATTNQVSALGKFGKLIGLGFQVRDDMLGIWGNTKSTGKGHGSDISRKKQALPVLYAFEYGTISTRQTMATIYKKPILTPRDISKVIDILNRLNAQEYCQKIAENYMNQALNALKEANLSDKWEKSFQQLAHFMVLREF